MHRTGRRVRSAAPAWLHPDHSLDPEREQVSSTASCTMAAVSTRSSSRRVGLPLPSTSRQPPKAWARCDVHHSLLPPAARRGRTVDYTRGWISSASKPPRCAACATIALRLGNAMAIRQPTHGHATCARRATTSSIMTQTVSSCAKITTRGHTSGDTFVMTKPRALWQDVGLAVARPRRASSLLRRRRPAGATTPHTGEDADLTHVGVPPVQSTVTRMVQHPVCVSSLTSKYKK